ncbi:MAG TPA: hypothetical protein PLK35_03340 [Candidatus Moranbacteria bacterium]|nr:hypothetical protein [Candidatus Moranbacteria bacterium]
MFSSEETSIREKFSFWRLFPLQDFHIKKSSDYLIFCCDCSREKVEKELIEILSRQNGLPVEYHIAARLGGPLFFNCLPYLHGGMEAVDYFNQEAKNVKKSVQVILVFCFCDDVQKTGYDLEGIIYAMHSVRGLFTTLYYVTKISIILSLEEGMFALLS